MRLENFIQFPKIIQEKKIISISKIRPRSILRLFRAIVEIGRCSIRCRCDDERWTNEKSNFEDKRGVGVRRAIHNLFRRVAKNKFTGECNLAGADYFAGSSPLQRSSVWSSASNYCGYCGNTLTGCGGTYGPGEEGSRGSNFANSG